MKTALALGVLLCTSAVLLAGPPWPRSPWQKPPEEWSKTDAVRVLQDSPWSPAKVKLDAEYTYRHADPLTGIVSDDPINLTNRPPVPGIQINRQKAAPPVRVLWWSSKALRSAILRLQQLQKDPKSASPVFVDGLPDYVLAIEGQDALRIFGDAPEKLQETVFLETQKGAVIDVTSVRLINAPNDGPRAEFHFPRVRSAAGQAPEEVNGQPTIDPNAERIVFHARATSSHPILDRTNAISVHAEFSPRAMRFRNLPDL